MASNALCALCGLIIIAAVTSFHGVSAQKGQCGNSDFWNSDLDICVPCASCKQYPKTPSCNTCKSVEDTPDVWKLAAITSFSVLAVVLVGAALIIGFMVHRRKSHKRPLRDVDTQKQDKLQSFIVLFSSRTLMNVTQLLLPAGLQFDPLLFSRVRWSIQSIFWSFTTTAS
eukprot:superscaffoldBa00000091_g1347